VFLPTRFENAASLK